MTINECFYLFQSTHGILSSQPAYRDGTAAGCKFTGGIKTHALHEGISNSTDETVSGSCGLDGFYLLGRQEETFSAFTYHRSKTA